MRLRNVAIAVAAAIFGMAGTASAHTIAVGTVNAGAPGSVTIWLGSYHTGAPNEGSLTLNSVTQAFNLVSNSLPAGLVVGSNYFYASGTSTPGEYNQAVNTTGLAETRWQGVTFTGLSAGTYTYQITGMNTVNFSDWNSSTPNWTGQLVIPESSVNAAVPEPATIWLVGLALGGMAARRRFRRK